MLTKMITFGQIYLAQLDIHMQQGIKRVPVLCVRHIHRRPKNKVNVAEFIEHTLDIL
jgi:hypothetical protein